MKKFAAVLILALGLSGCHADADDPVGQAEELSDGARRASAIENLERIYTNTLSANESNRDAPDVVAVRDATVGPLSDILSERLSSAEREAVLGILRMMRDERSIPALVETLNWETGVNESEAVTAARILMSMDIPADQHEAVTSALVENFGRIRQERPVDNQMRLEFLRTIGKIGHPSSESFLAEVMTSPVENQSEFQAARLAGQQLSGVATSASTESMIKALYMFGMGNPRARLNDIAGAVLVAIGQPAVAPLLETLRGNNSDANAIAEAYIAAVREVDEGAAEQMSAEQEVSREATVTLGSLGFADAYDALLAETQSEDMFRRVNSAIAIAQLNLPESRSSDVREMMLRVYGSMPNTFEGEGARAQIVANTRTLFDGSYFDFWLEEGGNSRAHPEIRLAAVKAMGLIANAEEAQRLGTWLESLDRPGEDDDDPYLVQFNESTSKAREVAVECDQDVACYIGKLSDSEADVVEKAASMLGRYGRGNAEAVTALVGALSHSNVQVRVAAARAIDRIATGGSPEAVEALAEMQANGAGTASWRAFAPIAIPTLARLRARAQ